MEDNMAIEKVNNIGKAPIAIIAGSESDLKIMVESDMFEILEIAKIPFELHIISADRNPDDIDEFCLRVKKERKVKVIVTVAGLAAVLASVIKAGVGIIPVLAAPLDDASLSSNINKPRGTTIGVCGALGKNACYNAAVLACEIVAVGDSGFRPDLEKILGMIRAEKPAQFDIDVELVKEKYLKKEK